MHHSAKRALRVIPKSAQLCAAELVTSNMRARVLLYVLQRSSEDVFNQRSNLGKNSCLLKWK